MVGIGKKTLLRDVNPHLICPLCRGYFIDATTVVECLHSFCRSCILKHLRAAGHCPSCKHVLNKAKPNIKADKTLQDIVYKLVPGLYHKEMRMRREFYKMHPEQAKSATPEQRGEDVSGRLIFNPEDVVSLSLEYLPPGVDPLTVLSIKETDTSSNSNNINGSTNNNNNNNNSNNNNNNNHSCSTASNRRYLQCPALVTIAHLKKFVAMKYSVDVTRYTIEICHLAPLPENWTLMDVAYIYAWKRIAPMRFFYRVAQEEQRLEAPLHHRPSTPGLGARDCLPPNDTRENDNNVSNEAVSHPETSKSEVKAASENETSSLTKNDSTRIASDEITSSANRKQIIEKNETSKINAESAKLPISTSTHLTHTTHVTLTTTTTSPSAGTNTSSSTTTCSNSNKQIKSPIKILKNSEGRYEVMKSLSSAANANEKEQTATTADIKSPPNPEFSVVNSKGVKLTLKQCPPLQSNNSKKIISNKPKIISNTLVRPASTDKDAVPMSAMAVLQQLQQQKLQEKEKLNSNPPSADKQEKQRRKVTFVDRLSTCEKTSPSGIVPKTALKKPAEQQDKKQFLQSFQLTAIESPLPDDGKLKKSPVRDTDVPTAGAAKCLQNSTAKVGEFSKKDGDELKKKSNTENNNLTANNSIATNTTTKCTMSITSAAAARTHTSKTDDADGRPFNSGTSLNSGNIASGNHAAKMDVYTFPNDPPIVPAGAVKRKCPPGVPIADLKRRRSQQIAQKAEVNKKQNVSQYSPAVKLPRISPKEHVIPTNRGTTMAGDHSGGSSGRTSNVQNAKTSTSPLISNETRDILMDGYGLNIPASLSITLTSPKSPSTSAQFVEPIDPNDNDSRKVTLNKMNPSITLNNRSLDPRVLKALKTGQIKMPASPPKAKPPLTAPMTVKQTSPIDRSETANQQRATTILGKRKKEQESSRDILDLSGGNKKIDMHPLRIPQPVTKLNKSNKSTPSKDIMQLGDISDQGQVVTLMGGHRYYRAPPGSLTPAAHRVNDCPLPSRTPVYAPSFGSINRSGSDLSSVFPSLPSLYALHQATNLQQYHNNLRLPPQRPPATERDLSSRNNNDNANSSISGITGKSHLAAQCAPIKPARSSMASLAVPINKQQSSDKFANSNVNRTATSDAKKLPGFRNNENLDSTDETSQMNARKRYSSNVESTNNRFSSGNNKDAKSNDQTTVESKTKDSNVESIDINNSKQQQQQQQQHRETTSPNVVSSTASPSPPPGNSGVNVRSESNTRQSDGVSNISNGDTNAISSPTKSNVNTEVTCSKSPVSPDSSSITIESSAVSKSCSISTDRESTEVQTSSNVVVKDPTGFVNPDDSVADDSTVSDDKSKFDKPEVNEITKQLLAVFPSQEWAKNPVAAEHLDNFFKSLNAMKNEESKADKIDRKTVSGDSPVKSKKDFAERS
ncbi:polycomb group protein Psc-like [Pseudomyrmex gracilis]|uniref:polycomb group protein Psc-like n=1 Tax=Pseudomyrmex gracilis TaxID=219809 RepID=UPI0009957AB8|nr:polycomb group protein Psc-like [Pseudomyrmex gracilis]